MTPEEKTLVQTTWKQVAPIAPAAADLFYQRLFEQAPEIESLFGKTDMTAQKSRLIEAVSRTVAGLQDEDSLRTELTALGRRHAGYGVQDSHYESVGAALLWTLETGLGEGWSEEACRAWTQAYGFIARQMSEGAKRATG
ncbi:globin family protein [Denitrobaculum tricleocarpae]|uniref:Hemin receptor n=1 Tax=Denitrobaculum tricleocarpae TaxID=2591009 RepID=A0A545TYB6_9PROT|nr:globin family protein [Denitrobaculum tricleocarpae]TQV82215.1 hemin receptor [Denitrobaculum tricleocarpae]